MKKKYFLIAIIISLSSYSQKEKSVTEKLTKIETQQYIPHQNVSSMNSINSKKSKIEFINGVLQKTTQTKTPKKDLIKKGRLGKSEKKSISFRLNLDTKKE